MKPVDFDFLSPGSLAETLAALAADDAEASKLLSGGQSLMPMLNLRLVRPARVIDIRRLPELQRVRDDGGGLVYGAGITHAAIEDGRVPDATPGWLPAVARGIAYRAVRNRGTIGGSLVHADPAADWVTALTALGGEAIVGGAESGEERSIPLPAFFVGPFATRLQPGELLTGVRLPKRGTRGRWGYRKFCRKVGEFAKAIGAVLVDPEREEVRAVVGAIERPPVVLSAPEALLADPRAAAELIAADLPRHDPLSFQLHATVLERAARRCLQDRVAA